MAPKDSPVVALVHFLDSAFHSQDKSRENVAILVSYAVFALASLVVLHEFSDRDFSAVITAGSGVQCFGFYLLLQKTRSSQSVAGISGKTLEMYVLVLALRLVSTVCRNGYLPVDRSGDYVYQVSDVTSLLLCLQLLFCVHKKHRGTYCKEQDSLQIWTAVPACVLGAVLLHGDLNHSAFYDTVWFAAMNIDTVAMLPQLYMFVRQGGAVEALTANYVAALFVSACCKAVFWLYGYVGIGDEQNLSWYHLFAGYWVVVAHGLQVLLSADFMYHYFRAAFCRGGAGMVLPEPCTASYDI